MDTKTYICFFKSHDLWNLLSISIQFISMSLTVLENLGAGTKYSELGCTHCMYLEYHASMFNNMVVALRKVSTHQKLRSMITHV